MNDIVLCEETGAIFKIKPTFLQKIKDTDYIKGSLRTTELLKRVFRNPTSYHKRGLLKKYKTFSLNKREKLHYSFFNDHILCKNGNEYFFKRKDVFFDEKYGFYSVFLYDADGDKIQVFFEWYTYLCDYKIESGYNFENAFIKI